MAVGGRQTLESKQGAVSCSRQTPPGVTGDCAVPIHNYLPQFVVHFAFYSLEVGAGNRHLVFDSRDPVMLPPVHSCGNSHLLGF